MVFLIVPAVLCSSHAFLILFIWTESLLFYFISISLKVMHTFSVILMVILEMTVGHRWLTLVLLATQGAEIRRITVQSQPKQIVHETLS
jgi:hypothetical protein